MNKSDSVVIIPTYNEKENIENIINAVFALLVIVGVAVDPTTEGLGDSGQATGYHEPKRDE